MKRITRLTAILTVACYAVFTATTAAEEPSPAPEGTFSIVALPDTQGYVTEKNAFYFESEIDWILDNRERQNIVFVSHVGDIVGDYKSDDEWAVARKNMLQLSDKLPFAFSVGNHDMLSFESQNKEVIATTFPEMTIISDSPGLGAYYNTEDKVIWAEHGHRYTLFNAPDIWSRAGGHLPMGYFISRLAASKSLTEGQVYTTPDVLDWFVKSPDEVNKYLQQGGYDGEVGNIIDDAFIVAVFNAIAVWSGNWPWDKFTMDRLDNFTGDPTVEDIAFMYDTIFSGWPSRQDIVDHYEAVWNDLGHLSAHANL